MKATAIILTMHFFADFPLQSRYIGENKGRDPYVLILHGLMYMIIMAVGTSVFLGDLYITIPFAVVNGVLHTCVDAATSKLTAWCYEKKHMYWFWNVIGLDQLIHVVTLLALYESF